MTKETILKYFDALTQKGNWASFLSDDLAFTNYTVPIKRIHGRAAYLEATKRFFGMITAVEVRDLMVDGPKACALTRYQLRPPAGPPFESDVAEIFQVVDGQIGSLDIYFDSVPFPKPPAQT
jgi:ketosteroid isomerase-like protein